MNELNNMNTIPDWDDWYLKGCYWVASKSKDKSTKIGALLTIDNRIISTGYNGIPIGVRDLDERQKRPIKYSYFEHAERNCIYAAARHGISTNNSVLYVNMFPCVDCARAIIQSGISTVVVHKLFYDLMMEHSNPKPKETFFANSEHYRVFYEKIEQGQQWLQDLKISERMFLEANIKVRMNTTHLNCVGLIGGKNVSV